MDQPPPRPEQRWGTGTPQARLARGLFDDPQWHSAVDVLAGTTPSAAQRPDRFLRSAANLYYVRTLNTDASVASAQGLDSVLRAVVQGDFGQINNALELAPQLGHQTAAEFLDDMLNTLRPIAATHQGPRTFSDVRAFLDQAVGMPDVSPADLQLALGLTTVFVSGGRGNAHPEVRSLLLARFLSGDMTVPPYANPSHMTSLNPALRRLYVGYSAWMNVERAQADDTDQLVISLFSQQNGQYVSMRELMAASSDPHDLHRRVIERLWNFLGSPAPSRAAVHSQELPVQTVRSVPRRGLLAMLQAETIPVSQFELILNRLTLVQILDILTAFTNIPEDQAHAVRVHVLAPKTQATPSSQHLKPGLDAVLGFVNEYVPLSEAASHWRGRMIMEYIAGNAPLPLSVVLSTEASSHQERRDLATSLTNLWRQALMNAFNRQPGQTMAAVQQMIRLHELGGDQDDT